MSGEYSIYALMHPITQKYRYVGRSKSPRIRYEAHLAKHGTWANAALKRGIKPCLVILEKGLSLKEACEREQYWIHTIEHEYGHPLDNLVQNELAQRKRMEAEIFGLACLTYEEKTYLKKINQEGYIRFDYYYGEILRDVIKMASDLYQIDTNKHRIALAEIALKFCEIPTHREERDKS